MAGRKQGIDPSARVGHRAAEEPAAVIRVDDTQAAVELPRPPDGLKWTVAAQKEWARLWNSPQAQVWEAESVYSQIVQLVTDFDMWLKMQRITRDMLTVKGSTGQARTNPLRAEMNTLLSRMQAMRRELFLTPRAMLDARIKVQRGRDENERAEAERLAAEEAERRRAEAIEGDWNVVGDDALEFADDDEIDEEDDIEASAAEDE